MNLKSKLAFFLGCTLINAQVVAAPAVFFNSDLIAGRTSFTDAVNSTVGLGDAPQITPVIYTVDIGAAHGQSLFTATSSSGPAVYVSTTRLGDPALNDEAGDIGGLGYTTWSVGYTAGDFSSVIDQGYKVSFFSDSARTTAINVNAIGLQTTNWGTCCTGNNTTSDGTLQPGSAIYMNFSGATSGNLLVGNITSSISGTEHFVGAINDTAFFNTMTLTPNGSGEFFGVGSYLMFSTVSLNSVPAGSSLVTVGAPSITDIITAGTFLLSDVVTGFNPIFDGGVLTLANNDSSAQTFTIRSTGANITIASGTATLSGVLSDVSANADGGLTKTGAGKLILSASNTYTGGTTISAGELQISADNNLGNSSGDITFSGGKLLVTETISTSRDVILSSSTTSSIEASSGKTYTINGAISGAGNLNISGGSVSLSSDNTYGGSTNITNGASLLLVDSASIENSSAVSTASGTFDISGATGNINLGGTYTQNSDGNLSMSFSPQNDQKLIVAGATSLAGVLTLNGSAGTYRPGKYTLITGNSVTGTFGSLATDLPSFTRLGYGLAYDAFGVYLILNPNLADTQASLESSAQKLKGIYNLQSAAVINGLTYDCRLFDVNNICLSTGGRYSNNHGASGYTTSALLIGAYRLNQNARLGAWIDQNLSTNTVTGINLSNSKPLFGVFGAWAENPSGEGYEVKVSAGYGDKDLTVTRDVIATSEAGIGSTRINNQAISTVSSYGFKLNNGLLASPYVGVQYSRVSSGGYTETTSADVTAPLTYGRLRQENVSILAGLKLSVRLDLNTALFGSMGVEKNINNRSGQYTATGLDGLTAIQFNSNVQKTRATASAGVYYDIDKKQRVSLSGIYREEAFNPTATTSVFATYTVGL
jgi:autotransporter-associated beta strand protein